MAVEENNNMGYENMGFMGSYFGFDDINGLSSFHHQQVLQPPPLDYHMGSSSSSYTSSFYGPPSSSLPFELVQSMSSDLHKQTLDIDLLLHLENKRLRRSIMQEEALQRAILLQKCEAKIKLLLLRKDDEISVAKNKTTELQAFLNGVETEAKAWEKMARENEALVIDLNKRLLLQQCGTSCDDAASYCGSCSDDGYINDDELLNASSLLCRVCRVRRPCVVFLPCRHLCCCEICDSVLGKCPVCQTVKEASLEAFLG